MGLKKTRIGIVLVRVSVILSAVGLTGNIKILAATL